MLRCNLCSAVVIKYELIHLTDQELISTLRIINVHYTTILIGRITGLACLCVSFICLSVCLPLRPVYTDY